MPSYRDIFQKHSGGGSQLIVPVGIESVDGSLPYRGLVDTGATRTAIREDLARRLRLSPGVPVLMESPGQPPQWKNTYHLRMTLPRSGLKVMPAGRFEFYITAVATDEMKDIDVFIGMDIIGRSTLIVKGRGRRFKISFPRGIVVPR